MKQIIRIGIIISSLYLLFGFFIIVDAAESTLQGSTFYKEVQHPENQITNGEALNLLMKPGQKQQVTVKIHNLTDEEITVQSRITGARTNGNGGLEYSPNKLKKSDTMKYDLPDLVKVPEETIVPASGTADLVLDINMPEIEYDGIVTGGIQLMEKGKTVETTDEKGATISNKIAYVFGVTLRMNEKEVIPDFDLTSVEAGLQNYRNVIFVNISNIKSMISKDLVLNAEITNKGKTDVLYEKKKTDVSMAPDSLIAFPVSLDGDRMKAGDYTAHITLSGYDNEWKWEENFTITNEEADKFNQQDPYLVQERGLDWKLIAIIVVSVILLVIIIVIISKTTKKGSKKNKSPKNK